MKKLLIILIFLLSPLILLSQQKYFKDITVTDTVFFGQDGTTKLFRSNDSILLVVQNDTTTIWRGGTQESFYISSDTVFLSNGGYFTNSEADTTTIYETVVKVDGVLYGTGATFLNGDVNLGKVAGDKVTVTGGIVFDESTNNLNLSVTDQSVGIGTLTIPNLAGSTETVALLSDITASEVLTTGSVYVGVGDVEAELPASTDGYILMGDGSTMNSVDVTGDIEIINDGTSSISTGVIVNADIHTTAGIVDTKLATISTTSKVSNSATTATDANTLNAIVARDGSGDFSANEITAALNGNASTATTAANVITNANLTGGVTSLGNAATVVTNANLTGEITSIGNATTVTNAAVIGKVLTGYTSGAGTVTAADNILEAIQKLNGNNVSYPYAINSIGTNGQVWKSDGVGIGGWGTDNNTTYSVENGGLTEINFTTTFNNKLTGIASGAEVNVQSDWSAISGDAFILNKPSLFTPSTLLADYSFTDNSTNWNTAYGWGNHGAVGYAIKSGTPADNQVAVWTGDGTIEGDVNFTWDATTLAVVGNITMDGISLALCQGLSWNSSTDVYARLGSLKGISTSQSAGDDYLPIHSDMKRCLLQDDGTVNYYVDTDNPIMKDGTTVTTTGTTDGTTAYKLVDTGADFVTDGIAAGQFAYNSTDDTYSIITAIDDLNTLSLERDIFITGELYDIGTANFGGTDGQVMVEIPKFYYKHTLVGTLNSWYISKYDLSGFELHPAFWKDGQEVDYRYISAFEGSMWDATTSAMVAKADITTSMYAAGDKMCSVAGTWAKVNETRVEYRAMSAERGTGFRQLDYYLHSAVQLLYLVEYADFNSQTMIGGGRTNLTGGGWTADSYIGLTGLSIGDGNGTNSVMSGTLYDIDGTGYLTDYMSYRGIENFFGNVWKMVDGITWDGRWTGSAAAQPVYVTNNVNYFADQTNINLKHLCDASYIDANADYISNIENVFGFIPSVVGASSTTKLTDYYYQYSVVDRDFWRVVCAGGTAGYGGRAGVFSLYSVGAWSLAAADVAGRLCY